MIALFAWTFGPIMLALVIADGVTVVRRRLRREFPEGKW